MYARWAHAASTRGRMVELTGARRGDGPGQGSGQASAPLVMNPLQEVAWADARVPSGQVALVPSTQSTCVADVVTTPVVVAQRR